MGEAEPPPTQTQIRAALNAIEDPCARIAGIGIGIVDFGLVRQIEIGSHGLVRVKLGLTGPGCWYAPVFADSARAALRDLPGVAAVEIVVDAAYDWSEACMSAEARARLAALRFARKPSGPKEGSKQCARS